MYYIHFFFYHHPTVVCSSFLHHQFDCGNKSLVLLLMKLTTAALYYDHHIRKTAPPSHHFPSPSSVHSLVSLVSRFHSARIVALSAYRAMHACPPASSKSDCVVPCFVRKVPRLHSPLLSPTPEPLPSFLSLISLAMLPFFYRIVVCHVCHLVIAAMF